LPMPAYFRNTFALQKVTIIIIINEWLSL